MQFKPFRRWHYSHEPGWRRPCAAHSTPQSSRMCLVLTQNHQTSGQQIHVEGERDMILGSIAWSECSARQPGSVSVLLMGLNEGWALLAESVRIQ